MDPYMHQTPNIKPMNNDMREALGCPNAAIITVIDSDNELMTYIDNNIVEFKDGKLSFLPNNKDRHASIMTAVSSDASAPLAARSTRRKCGWRDMGGSLTWICE